MALSRPPVSRIGSRTAFAAGAIRRVAGRRPVRGVAASRARVGLVVGFRNLNSGAQRLDSAHVVVDSYEGIDGEWLRARYPLHDDE